MKNAPKDLKTIFPWLKEGEFIRVDMEKKVSLKEIFEGIPKPKFEKINTLEKEIEERSKRMNDMLRWCKHEKQKIGELIRKAKNK